MRAFDDRDGVIWMNGSFVPWRDARIHVLTHSLHYAGCVFEGERAYDGSIFKSVEHTERLQASASALGYDLPAPVEQIERIKAEIVLRGGHPDCYVRMFCWRGAEKMGLSSGDGSVQMAVAAWKWGDYFAARKEGIRLTISRWARPAPTTAPCHAKTSGLYTICTMSSDAALAEGFDDALMYDHRGLIAEATGANIFFVRDGEVFTPLADCFLNGITRRTVIELAGNRSLGVHERHIHPDELASFSECFITGTAAEITPVRQIAGHRYTPSTITHSLMDDYSALTRQATTPAR